MKKILKFLGLLFPCFCLSACTFNDFIPTTFNESKSLKCAIDNSYLDSYINASNQVVINENNVDLNFFTDCFVKFATSVIPYSSVGTSWYTLNFGHHIYIPGVGTSTYIGLSCIFENSTRYIYEFNYQGMYTCFVVILDLNHNVVESAFRNSATFYFDLNSSYDFGVYFLDYLRLNSINNNPYDIRSFGFTNNYIYRFDFLGFVDRYNSLITKYLTISYNNVDYSSNGTLFLADSNGDIAFDIITSLQFPYSASIGDFNTRDNFEFNYVYSSEYQVPVSQPRQFLMFFNESNTNYYSYREFHGDFIFSGYLNSSYTDTYYSIGNSIFVDKLTQYYSRGSSNGKNELWLNKRYSYFVCDSPYIFNSLYFNVITQSDISSTGSTYVNRVVSPYFGSYRINDIHRYGYYGTSNFVTDIYFAYIDSFTCLGVNSSSINTLNSVRPVYYYNNGSTSSYVNDYNTSYTSLFTYHKVDNNTYFSFNDTDYNYVDIYLYSEYTKSYLNIPSNTTINYQFNSYSIVTTDFGTCIRLNTSQPYTLSNLPFFFTLTLDGYSHGYNFVFSFRGYSSYIEIPIVESGSFYDYFFAIFDTPLYMTSQFFILNPFGFNLFGVLLTLVGLAIVMFILRIIL